uniref:Beta-1,4-N-acetylgalactosaminyltransferase n=1 Tax=Steinernema glaseri TaxID=37863 RepID=A0A1I7ZD87_9BILA
MNSKIKLILLCILCGGAVHLLLSDCPLGNDYTAWIPSRSVVSFGFVQDQELDPIVAVLGATEAPSNFSAANLMADEMGNSSRYVFSSQPLNLSLCPVTPPRLVGTVRVWMDGPQLPEIEKLYPDLEDGGHGQPSNCRARHRVAIIIPYRDREEHLRIFLHNIHSILAKQQLDYAIFIVEQIEGEKFNRAKLMNVGFVEALKLYDWQCFIFHDVDLLPEDDRNLYSCPEQPRHMSVAVDKFQYKLPYGTIFGGITALTRAQVEKTNGYSNEFWGWGGEDDNMSERVSLAGYKISRYPTKIARYKMIKHTHDKANPVNKCRYQLLRKTKRRWKIDGLSNLNYTRISVTRHHLYTNIKVELREKESRAWLRSQGFSSYC